MGWLSKIFKGSSRNVSEGRYDGRYGSNVLGNYPSSSVDASSMSEMEDVDRAIAISLSEADQNVGNVIDFESQMKEDEQLARALQESLPYESPPQIENRGGNGNGSGSGHYYQPVPFSYSVGFRICAGCNTEIGHGRFLSCMGAVWHPECFRCHACNQPIADYEFSMSGNYPYHKVCYKEHYHPKCDVCKHFIPTNPAGLIEYRAHPFWSQKYCPVHELDGTPRCCSCERMEVNLIKSHVLEKLDDVNLMEFQKLSSIGIFYFNITSICSTYCMQARDTKFVALDDGRKVCLECLDSVIMDTNECQPLYLDIQEFYESLNMKVEQQVPLLLVERQALNEAMDGERHGHHHMPETRGLCLSEEQTISTILRRPRIGTGYRVMDMRTEPYKLTRRCEVTAILILYGLPRLLTGSILAHEMMHAWLRLRGYRTLSQDVEEGICQVLAHMWLESQGVSIPSSSSSSSRNSYSSRQGIRSPFERKLGEFFKHQIESDTSPIYGNGFRAANHAVHKYGLSRTLEHIRMTGSFPY